MRRSSAADEALLLELKALPLDGELVVRPPIEERAEPRQGQGTAEVRSTAAAHRTTLRVVHLRGAERPLDLYRAGGLARPQPARFAGRSFVSASATHPPGQKRKYATTNCAPGSRHSDGVKEVDPLGSPLDYNRKPGTACC